MSQQVTYEDTIAAIATPPGRGGIGMVRIAGPQALTLAEALLQLSAPLEHARARFLRIPDPELPDPEISDPDRQRMAAPPLDEGVVTAFHAPRSYTGDHVVELTVHGSPVVLDALLRGVLARGARLAEPGEFTRRAFLAGRLDLTQAEAVHDLIAAQTLEQARAAAQQLGGALSRRLAPVKERLLYLIALLEAGMDFASGELDDVDVVPPGQIREAIAHVHQELALLARSYRAGALLRSGAALAIVGRPNAGKSSLFNSLLERPRAIVTPLAGTTRDTVEESWSLRGMPIRLIDTAGLRADGDAPADEAERQGIERSHEALADADLVLLVHDATHPFTAEEETLQRSLAGRPHLFVRNKIDLLGPASRGLSAGRIDGALDVSALTGEGMESLREAVVQQLRGGADPLGTGALNNLRQQESVQRAMDALQQAAAANAAAHPHEVLLMDLHASLQALDTLTGTTTTDDILGRIFSTFCIGK